MNGIGIDLGTTNSAAACFKGQEIVIYKTRYSLDTTPSAVYLNRDHALIVGREARERYFFEPENAVCEFKRNMGADAPFTFKRDGRTMQPEDLSAEVLKSICADVARAGGAKASCAVITVPADFDAPQCDATMRAAQSAGIANCVLLTEPVAAAQAYSFEKEEDRSFWLVYDLGGGTFDAAVIQVRDGLIRVVGHGGNNRLGGSEIDVAILNELLIPALPPTFSEEDRQNIRERHPKWNGVWAKLKSQAEEAKIALSNPDRSSVEIMIDYLCKDANGEVVEFSYRLERADLDRLAAPIYLKTINYVKDVLASAKLKPSDVKKLILVGGPTLSPLLRDSLNVLGIPLEYGVDPMTVVARGAAIFAACQQWPDEEIVNVDEGKFGIRLDYPRITPDESPEVAGKLVASSDDLDFSGYTIEFVNETMRPGWRSGKIGLSPKGAFLCMLEAQRGSNHFTIEVCDPLGVFVQIGGEGGSFDVMVKGSGVIGDQVHSHDIGIELANDEVLVFYPKGAPLPHRRTIRELRTTVPVKKGAEGRFLCVPVCEGEKTRASRNRSIGELLIYSHEIHRDVPIGSEIDITVEIDKSHTITASAYIPLLDLTFEKVLKIESETPDANKLKADVAAARTRLAKVRTSVEASDDPLLHKILLRIDEERMATEAEQLATAAQHDAGAGRQCINVLNRLNSCLDDAEDALEWPQLVSTMQTDLAKTRDLVLTDRYAVDDDRRLFDLIDLESREAVKNRLPDAVRRCIQSSYSLRQVVICRDPFAWVNAFNTAKSKRDRASDLSQADALIERGERAISNNDVNDLKVAIRGLWNLIPDEEDEKTDRRSTVTRGR